jgi:hypothetical protein
VWTTFFFIVMWLMLFEVLFSIALGCLGLCLDVSLTCMIIGGPLVGKERCGVKNGAYVPLLVFMEGKE